MTASPSPASPSETVRAGVPNVGRTLMTSMFYTIVSVAIFGIVFPFVIAGIAGLVFPYQAHGSLLRSGTTVVGSALVEQPFTKPQYFSGRPSAAGTNGFDPTATGGSNYGPTSKALVKRVKASLADLRKANPGAGEPPPELVLASGSGIDPDISPAAAEYQVPRVARARGMTDAAVAAAVRAETRGRPFGIFGEPRVNVLELNRRLDAVVASK